MYSISFFYLLSFYSLDYPPIMLPFSSSSSNAIVNIIGDLHVDKSNGQFQCSPYFVYNQH